MAHREMMLALRRGQGAIRRERRRSDSADGASGAAIASAAVGAVGPVEVGAVE